MKLKTGHAIALVITFWVTGVAPMMARSMPAKPEATVDAPYLVVERQITQSVRGGEKPEAIQARYHTQVVQNQANVMAIFGWAFATLKVLQENEGTSGEDWAMEQVLAHDDPGNVPEFTRIRFGLIQEIHPGKVPPALLNAAEAVLRSKPADDYLRQCLVYELRNDQKTLPRALVLAQQGVDRNPKSQTPTRYWPRPTRLCGCVANVPVMLKSL